MTKCKSCDHSSVLHYTTVHYNCQHLNKNKNLDCNCKGFIAKLEEVKE